MRKKLEGLQAAAKLSRASKLDDFRITLDAIEKAVTEGRNRLTDNEPIGDVAHRLKHLGSAAITTYAGLYQVIRFETEVGLILDSEEDTT